jgi:hypothetical protein
MPGFVLTLPIAASKIEAWRRFCQELSGSQRALHEVSRQRLGIRRERLALVESSVRSYAVTTLEVDDVDLALAGLLGSELPFESWYRARLQELHGVTLARYEQNVQPEPAAPPQELLFEWTRPDSADGPRSIPGP